MEIFYAQAKLLIIGILTVVGRLFENGRLFGGVPKRSTGADCKSAGYAFVGSNPTPSTRTICLVARNRGIDCNNDPD